MRHENQTTLQIVTIYQQQIGISKFTATLIYNVHVFIYKKLKDENRFTQKNPDTLQKAIQFTLCFYIKKAYNLRPYTKFS